MAQVEIIIRQVIHPQVCRMMIIVIVIIAQDQQHKHICPSWYYREYAKFHITWNRCSYIHIYISTYRSIYPNKMGLSSLRGVWCSVMLYLHNMINKSSKVYSYGCGPVFVGSNDISLYTISIEPYSSSNSKTHATRKSAAVFRTNEDNLCCALFRLRTI